MNSRGKKRTMVRFWVGVSGFSYPAWQGVFYPDGTKPADMLNAYSGKLNSVEINSSFYHTPTEVTARRWGSVVGEGFRFSFKANRRITHIKKLRDAGEDFVAFTGVLRPLRDKLGCVLVQLPPYVKRDEATLEGFLNSKPESLNVALEFRHDSWFDDGVNKLLSRYNAALCVADTEDMKPVFSNTASFLYVRLRRDNYSKDELTSWAKRLQDFSERSVDCFVYFKHDEKGEAAKTAQGFKSMLVG
jgi:uncharacterized protein YecE (DUF72 family)